MCTTEVLYICVHEVYRLLCGWKDYFSVVWATCLFKFWHIVLSGDFLENKLAGANQDFKNYRGDKTSKLLLIMSQVAD